MLKKQIDNITFLFEQEVSYPVEEIEDLLGALYEEFLIQRFISIKQSVARFSYVGIASNHDRVICILPKHLHRQLREDAEYVTQARLLINILKTYERRIHTSIDSVDFFSSSKTSDNTNEIAIADFLLKDFVQYGIWVMDQHTVTSGGKGEVLWDHTIERTEPLINKAPIYYDTHHLHSEVVADSLVSQIHRWAVAYSMHRYGLLLDFDLSLPPEFNLWVTDFGANEFLLATLEGQLRVTYADRELRLLRALMELIQITNDYTNDEFSIYGHNSFEHVWEDAIGFCFGNEYKHYEQYLSKPIWENDRLKAERHTLRPDVLRWLPHPIKPILLIIDAKYYLIKFDEEEGLTNNPGVGDIVKQYFYEFILYRTGIRAPWADMEAACLNVLVFPMLTQSEDLFHYNGTVCLPSRVTDRPIINMAINPALLFTRYCEYRQFKLVELEEFIERAFALS
ncbi:LlaJI family restriction endonuclease [Parapedobacter sp. 10938]|uniref:LlaJI family restriction endonuclease n=1 Tax=Parapedobacter flavus TaxID=3110225 RepID=UPI002DBCE316|nr:LlaJI family restriction endonuclease [Parapedobacter sp. 10938]MEC3881921.1 LlaJI family restriction endonuclease [Parapedobacter sp. 10938]